MNINKKLKSMLVAAFMLLTFISVNAAPTSSQLPHLGLPQPSGGSSDNCYDGVCFEGEVEGNSLMTYENLIKELGIGGKKPSIFRDGYEEIYDKNAEEESKGGIWLKFTDSKYTRNGKPRTYYVMKKPARMGISWSTLHAAGAVYGWDVIDENTGLPKSNPEKYKNIEGYGSNKDYKAKIVTINGEKYIIRLLQGRTNYGGDVTNNRYWSLENTNNSEWNRTILPITKGYRFGGSTFNKNYAEKALRDGDKASYDKRSYKIQTANYNWFGDLTLGANDNWIYDGKSYTGLDGSYVGQMSWTQEFSESNYRTNRGNYDTDYNAAGSSSSNNEGYIDNSLGVRLVLEPYNPPKQVEVKQTIKLKKFDPDKKPLAGVKFILNGDTYTTDSKGEAEIPVWKYPAGNMKLIEPKQTIGGITYTKKEIPVNRDVNICKSTIPVMKNCYDGVCFWGEVEGNKLITYENLISQLGIIEGEKPSIPRSGYEEIYDKNAEEESKGGIWLKFTDSKYTRDGKPRTYYVMKKPARMGVSWNTLYTAGAVYGWDVINPNTGLPKSNPEKYKNIGAYDTNKEYKGKIITINGEKYIVRLLQGRTNYGGDVTNTKLRQYNTDNNNSEWNRTILPITQEYRFGTNTDKDSHAEQALRDSNGNSDYSLRSYKVQTANYNWFGDLTLSSYINWNYNGKKYTGRGNYAGQWNWVQEFASYNYLRSYRGDSHISSGTASSEAKSSEEVNNTLGIRLVLEPYNSQPFEPYSQLQIPEPKNCYDGVCFQCEVDGSSLVSYKNILKIFNSKTGKSNTLIPNVSESTHKEIYDLYKQELSKGGMYLKFTDSKYQRDGKPRTFYISKKPVTNNISYNDLFKAGMIYGWDHINPDGTIKSGSDIDKSYKPTILSVNGEKYIVRLAKGRSNYGDPIQKKSGSTDYKWQDALNSEWNRTMVAITKQYRGESGSMEQALKEGNSSTQWVTNNYKNQTAEYNWFGDLTLGTWGNTFKYNNNDLSSVKGKGQYNWTQEYSGSNRSLRGSSSVSSGVANSGYDSPGNAYDDYGWRLVLEPLTTNN